ncbi:MAG: transposase [Verrucomicrobiota bacterium]
MRALRRKIGAEEGAATYHCLSRVVDQRFIFGTEEKERFTQLLREYEQFCGVQVLTYCLMSNHFHILVEVPQKPQTPLPEKEVLRRLAGLSGAAVTVGKARQMLEMFAAAHDEAGAQTYLDGFRHRMGDVSEFIKLLKQRFTQWYNRRKGRQGTLWEDRFKSVLVEGTGDALVTMAAYIDLNPVRAGLVEEPGLYRWSGYGEALAGNRQAKEGIRTLYGRGVHQPEVNLTESMEGYRRRVFTQGEEGREGTDATGAPRRNGIAREAVMRVLAEKGRLEWADYLRCRVRYFSDGVAVGSREFVESMFGKFRSTFSPQRRSGARRMRGLNAEMFSLRDLREKVFG